MRTKSIMWDMFTETGNIEIYLKYKEHCRTKQNSGETQCPNKQSKQKQ